MPDTETIIRRFIISELMHKENESCLKLDDPILRKGIIDSIGIQQLVAFLESEFNIAISDDELTAENFQTVLSISNLVKKLEKTL